MHIRTRDQSSSEVTAVDFEKLRAEFLNLEKLLTEYAIPKNVLTSLGLGLYHHVASSPCPLLHVFPGVYTLEIYTYLPVATLRDGKGRIWTVFEEGKIVVPTRITWPLDEEVIELELTSPTIANLRKFLELGKFARSFSMSQILKRLVVSNYRAPLPFWLGCAIPWSLISNTCPEVAENTRRLHFLVAGYARQARPGKVPRYGPAKARIYTRKIGLDNVEFLHKLLPLLRKLIEHYQIFRNLVETLV